MKLKTSFLRVILSFLIIIDSVSAQEICINGFFKPNNTDDLNRRLILSSLDSNVTTHNGFFNSSIGQDPNRIFIIAMCIPGTKPETCSKCIKGASDGLLQSCLNQTDAYTWPDCCMVRYSNVSISGSFVMEPSQVVSSTGYINSNVTVFDRIGEDLLARTITPSKNHGHKYFAAGVASFITSQTVYAMMQCTPDIPPGFCGFCLRQNLHDYETCCRDEPRGAIIRPICFIRWDLHPFAGAFENITLPQQPLSLTPPVSNQENTTDQDGGKNAIGTIVAFVVPTVVVLVLLVIGFLVCWRRKSYKTIEVQAGEDIITIHSQQFDLKAIEAATGKFSESNMIGRGGFGVVYMGMLSTGGEETIENIRTRRGRVQERGCSCD